MINLIDDIIRYRMS